MEGFRMISQKDLKEMMDADCVFDFTEKKENRTIYSVSTKSFLRSGYRSYLWVTLIYDPTEFDQE
jgi:hypothetical protein